MGRSQVKNVDNENGKLVLKMLLVPVNLDLGDLPEKLKKHPEEGLWITHLLFGRKHYLTKRKKAKRWYELNFQMLAKVVDNRRVKTWLEYLKSSKMIVVKNNGWYVNGVKSRSYGMHSKFHNEAARVHVVKDRRLADKIDKFQKERDSQTTKLPIHDELEKQIHRVRIRKEEAIYYVQNIKKYDDPRLKDRIAARKQDESAIEMLASKFFFFKVDDYGRVHHNLTNLSSDLLKFIYAKNSKKPLTNTDTRNSQPFILGIVLMELRKADHETTTEIHRSLAKKIFVFTRDAKEQNRIERAIQEESSQPLQPIDQPGTVAPCSLLPQPLVASLAPASSAVAAPAASIEWGIPHTPYMNCISEDENRSNPLLDIELSQKTGFEKLYSLRSKDLRKDSGFLARMILGDVRACVRFAHANWAECQKYIDLCCSGQFYEFLFDKLAPDSPYRKFDRGVLKEYVFRETIFCRNPNAEGRELRDIFAKEFPVLWKIICRLKKRHHSVLPKLMQHYESNYVIRIAAESFVKAHPGRFLVTIHDSLIVESDLRHEASRCLLEAFKETGLFPSVSVVDLTTHFSSESQVDEFGAGQAKPILEAEKAEILRRESQGCFPDEGLYEPE